MAKYLMNCWYAAAWSQELSEKPLARTYLDVPVMLFRKGDGTPAALHDRCPHRFAPLSMGMLDGERIECPYHGLVFDHAGICIDARFNAITRENAKLRAFPVIEAGKAVWIWMGDPAKADPALLPDFAYFDRPELASINGYTHMCANYQLEVDNLMDLSHIDFVHTATISGGVMEGAAREARQEGGTVHFDTLCASVPCLPNFEPYIRAEGRPTDHWLDLRWDAPGNILLDLGVTLAERPRDEGYTTLQGHFLTPETEFSTHYFWGLARPDGGEPPEFDEMMKDLTRRAFEGEDLPMIEAVQQRMGTGTFWEQKPVIFPEDAGAIRARRVLDKLIAEEMAAT